MLTFLTFPKPFLLLLFLFTSAGLGAKVARSARKSREFPPEHFAGVSRYW